MDHHGGLSEAAVVLAAGEMEHEGRPVDQELLALAALILAAGRVLWLRQPGVEP